MVTNDVANLWDYLVKEGGLNLKTYDKDIIADFQLKLFGTEVSDFRESLKVECISIERFLTTFFESLEPFTKMMSDLLVMFEKAGAKSNGNNLKISINSELMKEKFDFDINYFIDIVEKWNKTLKSLIIYHLNEDKLWEIKETLNKFPPVLG